MTRQFRRKIRSTTIVLVVCFLLACGPIFAGLRLAIASANPLIAVLVSRGVIKQADADKYKAAFTAGVDAAADLETDWKSATTKAQKLAAIQKASNRWTVAIGDLTGAPPQLMEAVQIINGIFDTLIAFYSGAPSRVPGAANPKSEGELKAWIKQESERLKKQLEAR